VRKRAVTRIQKDFPPNLINAHWHTRAHRPLKIRARASDFSLCHVSKPGTVFFFSFSYDFMNVPEETLVKFVAYVTLKWVPEKNNIFKFPD